MHVRHDDVRTKIPASADELYDSRGVTIVGARPCHKQDLSSLLHASRSVHAISVFAGIPRVATRPTTLDMSLAGIPLPGRFDQIMSAVILSPFGMSFTLTTLRNAQSRICFSLG